MSKITNHGLTRCAL